MGSVLRQAFAFKKKLNKDGLLLQSVLAVTDHLELYVTKHGEPLGWTFVFRTSCRHVRLKICKSARHFIFKMIAFSKTLWATTHSLLGLQIQDCITVQRQRSINTATNHHAMIETTCTPTYFIDCNLRNLFLYIFPKFIDCDLFCA